MSEASRPKTGGRAKGVPNKKTELLMETCERIGVDPFEVLVMIVANDWKGLGYVSESVTKTAKDGSTFYEDRISLDSRLTAAKEACKYLYPQRKAVELSNPDDQGFRVILEDYTTKK